MKLLEDRILADGKVAEGNVLQVDSFLNHQLDIKLLCALGQAFYELYKDAGVSKILTIEASGIAIAALTAQYFGVPMLFAKKNRTANLPADIWHAQVDSFTHGVTHSVFVAKAYLHPTDRVLLLDDFLANGSAMQGLYALCRQAGATVVGAGIVIEKAYQGGGDLLRAQGLRIESLAKIAAMSPEGIVFEGSAAP
ncbi:MAG: xanthine phosphoribosyltransferase [Eubacteriales bacterium]